MTYKAKLSIMSRGPNTQTRYIRYFSIAISIIVLYTVTKSTYKIKFILAYDSRGRGARLTASRRQDSWSQKLGGEGSHLQMQAEKRD